MQQQVNGTLKPQFTRQACKEIELSKESSSRLQRKLKKLLCGTRPILLYPKVGDSKAVVRHFVSHPDDFNTPHGLHRVIKRHNILDTEVDVACSNNDKFRGDTTRQYVRLKIKHMVDMLAAEVYIIFLLFVLMLSFGSFGSCGNTAHYRMRLIH
eukprot:282306_1